MKKLLLLVGIGYFIKTKEPKLWESLKQRVLDIITVESIRTLILKK